MTDVSAFQAYLNQANDVLRGQVHLNRLTKVTRQLPPLNENLLEELAQAAEKAALSDPRRSWAIALVADSAACDSDVLIRSRAAWYLGRAYNDWGQPKKVTETIARARQGFEELHETHWMAACDWQTNHLAWTKPNFTEAVWQLETALAGLEQTRLDTFASQCRLALSYAQILWGNFAAAEENLKICEKTFTAQKDPINRARGWQNEANCQRRQGNFENAYIKLEQALAVFSQHGALLDIAKTHYQLGLWWFLSGHDYPKAVVYFKQAATVFSNHSMDLWSAVCENGLAQIDIQNGNFAQAIQELQRARMAFVEHSVFSLIADNHNDSGQLELMLGNLAKSLEHFQQAKENYKSLGFELAATNALANQGNVSALMGYFQKALHDLELAQKRFQQFENPFGLAGCTFYLARIWTDLNQYSTAHAYLNQTETLFRQIKQTTMLGQVHNQRAQVFSLEGRFVDAAEALKTALEISREAGLAPQIALAERRLGEMLSHSGELEQARALLIGAESKFQQMGMAIEQAASLEALGAHYLQVSATQDAEKAFHDGLALCTGIMPEIESRIYTGLAVLDEKRNDFRAALTHYRATVQSIAKLRNSFWQSALAGSYLQTVSSTLDKSVQLAAKLRANDDALYFIESSKARVLVRQLSTSILKPITDIPVEIQTLWLEIQGLQAQIRAIYNPSPWSPVASDLKMLQGKLIETVQTYDKYLAKLERKTTRPISDTNPEFQLAHFRDEARTQLGESWLALDYYLTATTIIISVITPDHLEVFHVGLSARVRMALELCVKGHRGASAISLVDMKALGQILLSKEIQPYISSPSMPLIISPHRELHSIPWAALLPDWATQHLVEVCIPMLAPSLQLLQLLWQRTDQGKTSDRTTGLLLGVSDFQGRRPSLPSTLQEVREIAKRASSNSITLIDSEATWGRLLDLHAKIINGNDSVLSFSFLHISSHINHDSRTGRLSSVALYDQEISLEQFKDIAPLPQLVTLSACNGTQSLVYEGDEHVGMATTCLITGANTVIGSLWPILDSAAALSMINFYQNFLSGFSPAQALAQSQRDAIKNGEDLQNWASFICLGS